MHLYFTTVIRAAPPSRGGALVSLDWSTKRVEASVVIAPTDPTFPDDNPRGNSRGGRGIVRLGGELVVGSYHTLKRFSSDLSPRGGVSHGLLVGIHELASSGDGVSVWAAATSIDAALRIRVDTGELLEGRWPREHPALQQALGVSPLAIDKTADNRGRFMGADDLAGSDRLHLNALRLHDGRLLGLLHGKAAIADLDDGRILVRHPSLERGHNLIVTEDGIATVNDTYGRTVRSFDLATGGLVRTIDLMTFPWVRDLERSISGRTATSRLLARAGLGSRGVVARPLFVRGLARLAGRLYVGLSPASILEIDEASGQLLDAYQHSDDVSDCVHGLLVEPSPEAVALAA